MPEQESPRILVVDDDHEFRRSLSKLLVKERFEVWTAADGFEAQTFLAEVEFDLVIADLKMPGKNGLQLLREIKSKAPRTEVLIITAYGEMPTYLEAMNAGAFQYLDKPVKREEVLQYVRKALTKGGNSDSLPPKPGQPNRT